MDERTLSHSPIDHVEQGDEPEFALGEASARGTLLPDVALAAAATPAWPPLFAPRLTPGDRTRRAAGIAALLLLTLALLLLASPGLRVGAKMLATSWLPTPSPTLVPGSDRFYLLPNVPWGTVLLDGRPLAHVPVVGDGPPLLLSRGSHHFEWHATPFELLRCQVSVPASPADSCSAGTRSARLFVERAPDGASIIPAHDDLSALPVAQRAALLMTVQIALEESSSSTILRPGERYAYLPSLGQPDHINIATQPLRATLNFHLLASLGLSEPCAISDPRVQPCRFAAQDCSQLCTLPSAPAAGALDVGRAVWFASTFAWVSWNYDTLSGAPVAHNQDDPGVTFRLVDLAITWDGAFWRVAPMFGHRADTPTVDDTVCSTARVLMSRGPLTALLPDGNVRIAVAYFSDAAPADGCAVLVKPSAAAGSPTGSPGALYLARCGVLIAANDQAHALWPALPRADAAESRLAFQLAGQSVVS